MKCLYNPYELLYMYRTGDPHALGMLTQAYGGFLNNIVQTVITSNPEFACYRDDLYLECLIALKDAVECYREDRETSFSTFLTVVARRKLWRYLRPLIRQKAEIRGKTMYLEDAVTEKGCLYDVISQNDCFSDPVFFTEYNCLYELLDHLIMKMKTDDRRIIYAWMRGENYKIASDRLGLSSKAYDGRLNRIRRKVRTQTTLNRHDLAA